MTFTVLVALVLIAGLVGFKTVFKPLPPLTDSISLAEACTTREETSEVTVRTRDITVSIYNASSVKGLANSTLDTLTNRGFKAGEVGNAPEGTEVADVLVQARDASDPRVTLLARQFGEDTVIQEEPSLGPGITVIVGADFDGIDTKSPKKLTAQITRELCE